MRITQTILTSVMTVLISTALVYTYEIRAEVTLIKNRLSAIEKDLASRPIAYRLDSPK